MCTPTLARSWMRCSACRSRARSSSVRGCQWGVGVGRPESSSATNTNRQWVVRSSRCVLGEVVEKLDLADTAAAGDQAGVVIVAMIVPVGQVDHLRVGIHHAITRIEASGVRRFWIYRGLDDPAEAMILQEIASERQARRWIRHPDAAARFMSHAGEGAYPPPFVGRLVETIEVPAPPADPQ